MIETAGNDVGGSEWSTRGCGIIESGTKNSCYSIDTLIYFLVPAFTDWIFHLRDITALIG